MRKHTAAVRALAILTGVLAGLCFPAAAPIVAQSSSYAQAPLSASHNGQFRESHASVDRLLNALAYTDAARYEVLWTEGKVAPPRLETVEYTRLTRDVVASPPRLPSSLGTLAPTFSRAVPRIVAMIEWADAIGRQAYDALAAGGPSMDGHLSELVAYHRSRPDVAISSKPKSPDALDAQFFSLAFRERYPKFNGLTWASRWLELSLYEALVVSERPDERRRMTDAAVQRYQSMVAGSPEAAPYLMPLAPVVAPAFTRRYPELAALIDNKHMLQDVLADILVSREVPASAREQETMRAGALFRSDTAFAAAYEPWLAMRTTIGAQNMGGPGVDFGAGPPQPTVARGMSLAGAVPRLQPAAPAAMAGMQHDMNAGAMPTAAGGHAMAGMSSAPSMDVVMSVYQRMLQDPVIRERMATDPVIQGLLGSGGTVAAPGATMPGMAMPGMNMTGATGAVPMTEERRQAVEFIVRLLSDPSVAARIHADPELHRLWSDPDVQRRLSELNSAQPTTTPRTPQRPAQPPTPPAHRH